MIMNDTTIKTKALLIMFVIACGENDGEEFVYYPNLPSCFSEHIDFATIDGHFFADLVSIRVNSDGDVGFLFQGDYDEDIVEFHYSWESIVRLKPMLAASVLTYVYDMVENLKEC